MNPPDRLTISRTVGAMVALDTIDLLAARVRKLLSWDRRISMTQRYTWTDSAPDLLVGLRLDTQARSGGFSEWAGADGRGFAVYLKPGLMSGFGFAAYAFDGNTTEAEAWKRYHAAEATSADFFKRRHNMTRIDITGGLADDGPARDDLIVIRAWNAEGVCDEKVIGFDTAAHWAARHD